MTISSTALAAPGKHRVERRSLRLGTPSYRIQLTRVIVDAIHSGALARAARQEDPVFGFDVITECPGVPAEILVPRITWADQAAFDAAARKLAGLFRENFRKYEAGASAEVRAAGPA